MKIGMCFSVLDPENARKLGKLVKFFMVVSEPRKKFREND